MNRRSRNTILTTAALTAAGGFLGCASAPERDTRFYYEDISAGDGVLYQHHVGVGDMIGSAVWGREVTLAKARQTGGEAFAGVVTD